MSNKEKIQQLEDKCAKLREEIYKIRDEITALELEGINYEGKYIELADYGYMYVTWQKIDKKTRSEPHMFFQAYMFRGGISTYTDDFWISSDAMEDVWIPMVSFMRYIEEDRIKEITREEFIEGHNKMLKEYADNFLNMLEAVEHNYGRQNVGSER